MCIPKVLKLYKAINKAYDEIKDGQMCEKPYGKGNPYYYCSVCQNSIIQGHSKDCRYNILLKKISNMEHQASLELNRFVESGDYLKKSFKHFLWFKKDKQVDGLFLILEAIRKHEAVQSNHQKESKKFEKFINTGIISE